MNHRFVQSLILLVLFISFCGPVSAYYLTLDAPAEVKVGEQIQVSGSTNTPPPDKIDIVFSQSANIPVEIDRQSISITEKGDTTFNVTFDTAGLEKGNYKIEGLSQSKRDFSAGSRSLRVVKLEDRSDLVTIVSPTWQEFEKELNIEAKISGYKENAIQMEVKKGDKTLFGPESIPASHGTVQYVLPISETGSYNISFSDYDGFIGSYTIVTEEKDRIGIDDDTGSTTSSVITPSPTPTPEPTKKTGTSKLIQGISSTAEVSRDSPAYFLVDVNSSPVTIQASGNTDWVLEYKTSPDGAEIKVNDEMGNVPEQVTLSNAVSEVYLKVYPYSFKATETVTVTSDHASSIILSDKAAEAFGVPPRYGNTDGSEKKTPLPVWVVLVSIGICLITVYKRRV